MKFAKTKSTWKNIYIYIDVHQKKVKKKEKKKLVKLRQGERILSKNKNRGTKSEKENRKGNSFKGVAIFINVSLRLNDSAIENKKKTRIVLYIIAFMREGTQHLF